MKQTAPNNKKKGRVPTPFLSECQTIAAPLFSKADAKVADLGIRTKYTRPFYQKYQNFFIND